MLCNRDTEKYRIELVKMESEENEVHIKQAMILRSDKNVAIDYDEDRVRLELTNLV